MHTESPNVDGAKADKLNKKGTLQSEIENE